MGTGAAFTWSFDEALHTAPSGSQRGRRRSLRLLLRACASRATVQPMLAALVLVYITLAGFTCARWCELLRTPDLPAGTLVVHAHAHAHHVHAPAANAPSAVPAVPASAHLPASGQAIADCQVQTLDASLLTGLFARPPALPVAALLLIGLLMGRCLPPAPLLRPAVPALAPLHPPPRSVR